MSDLLNMRMINNLPHPLLGDFCGNTWPIHDIDVETGLLRIDVCGMLEIKHFGELIGVFDADGVRHEPDDFYVEDCALTGQRGK